MSLWCSYFVFPSFFSVNFPGMDLRILHEVLSTLKLNCVFTMSLAVGTTKRLTLDLARCNAQTMIQATAIFFTPPQNRGWVIFSLQFVCVCVCLSVCPALLVNKIPVKWMHRFGRGFC